MSDSLPVLFNATHEDVFVTTSDGRRVPLPRVTAPQVVDKLHIGPGGSKITFGFPPGEDGEPDPTQFTISAGVGHPDITLDLPPVLPGVFYLVEPDVLWRLKHRTDLVAIRAYAVQQERKDDPIIKTLATVCTGLTATDVELPDVPFRGNFLQWLAERGQDVGTADDWAKRWRDVAQEQSQFPPEEYEQALLYWQDRLTVEGPEGRRPLVDGQED